MNQRRGIKPSGIMTSLCQENVIIFKKIIRHQYCFNKMTILTKMFTIIHFFFLLLLHFIFIRVLVDVIIKLPESEISTYCLKPFDEQFLSTLAGVSEII